MSFRSRPLTCVIWEGEGGATTEWYQILESTRDLAIRTLPRRDKNRECSESTFEDILETRESHKVSILVRVSGKSTPRVARGRTREDWH